MIGEYKPRQSANWKVGEASARVVLEERKDGEMAMTQRQPMFPGEDGRLAHVDRDNEILTVFIVLYYELMQGIIHELDLSMDHYCDFCFRI